MTHDLHLITVTETNLDASIQDSEIICGDWSVIRRDRGRPGGGVMMLWRPPVKLRRLPQYEGEHIEELWARFELCGHYIYIYSSSDESPGVGLSLNRSQHDAALPSTTPRQERKSSTDYSEPRHRTEVDPERTDAVVARVKTARTDRRVPNGPRRRASRVTPD
ncbi:unnamed protein product [Leptosia nina]|uniref:Uncharacterized protein n=1 Tax=Leptosia nina TaxID=320188 RepID=A0AAV1JQ32_9NEOP